MPTYSPQNPSVFQAAFTGALAGIAVNNAPILDPVPADYLPADAIAGAYAQAVDTVWAGASADCLELAVRRPGPQYHQPRRQRCRPHRHTRRGRQQPHLGDPQHHQAGVNDFTVAYVSRPRY